MAAYLGLAAFRTATRKRRKQGKARLTQVAYSEESPVSPRKTNLKGLALAFSYDFKGLSCRKIVSVI